MATFSRVFADRGMPCVSMTSLELSYATSSSWRGSNRAVTTNFLDARVQHMKIGAAPNYVTFIGCR